MALPSLRLGWMADDYAHRATFVNPESLDGLFTSPFTSMYGFFDGDPERTTALIDRGLAPWFTPPETRLHFFRPLDVATHWLDYRLWPNTPALMHLQSVLWFATAVFLVALLYRRLMGPTLAAGLAALLFTLDDAHALPAAWLANRNSLIALVLGTVVLMLHHQWRESKRHRWAPLALALYAAALFVKEDAISICAYLFAYTMFVERGRLPRRFASLAPYAAVTVCWRILYQSMGFGAEGFGWYLDPLLSPLAFLQATATKIPILFTAQFAFPPSDFYQFAPLPAKPYFMAWAVTILLALLTFFLPLLRVDRTARFWATGAALSFIPVCATSGTMDRLLSFAGIGAMGFLAQFLVAVKEGAISASPPWLARPRTALYRTLLTIHIILAPLMFIAMMHLFAAGEGILRNTVDAAVPKTEDISEKSLVLANAANFPIGFYLNIQRALDGVPAPSTVRSLAGPSVALVPMRVERLSETALLVTTPGGYGDALSTVKKPPRVGDRVELTGVTMEVVALAEDGTPELVRFEFNVPLENPSLLWLELRPTKARPWTPPAIGETVTLNDFDLDDF